MNWAGVVADVVRLLHYVDTCVSAIHLNHTNEMHAMTATAMRLPYFSAMGPHVKHPQDGEMAYVCN